MMVFTAMGTAMHRHCLFGATALFLSRAASWIYSRGGHRHGCGGAPPLLSREQGLWGLSWVGHRHPHGGATVTLSGDQLAIGRPLEFDRWGHHHPLSSDRTALSGALAESSSKG